MTLLAALKLFVATCDNNIMVDDPANTLYGGYSQQVQLYVPKPSNKERLEQLKREIKTVEQEVKREEDCTRAKRHLRDAIKEKE